MPVTPKGDAATPEGDVQVRLRVEVYDALAEKRGIRTVVAQAAFHRISRQHMSGLRSGRKRPSAALAMQIAHDLNTPVEALWGRSA